MTIKEVEARSGMTRANIRFYESEGLLKPVRLENGYRDYSAQDVETLKRIRLLRTLHISLEEVKALAAGEHALMETLARQLEKLEQDKTALGQSQEICWAMRRDGVRYETLDAQRYLDALNRGPLPPVPELEADSIPKVRSPWRRWLARGLDLAIYSTLWDLILLFLNVNIAARGTAGRFLDLVVQLLMMLLLEPLLLCKLGTTPGKWLLGLYVTAGEDRRLTYLEALARTWDVLSRGMGFGAPIYNLIRLGKSYAACEAGKTLAWEEDSTLVLRPRPWRTVAYVGAYGVLLGATVLAYLGAQMPRHRGDLTAAAFCSNYNQLAEFYQVQTAGSVYLDPDGHWTEPKGVTVMLSNPVPPDFVFTEVDGVVTAVSFSQDLDGPDQRPRSLQDQMILSALSLIGAQPEAGILSGWQQSVLDGIGDDPFSSFQFTQYGITVTCTVEYTGYEDWGTGDLWPQDGEDCRYSIRFVMEKTDGTY